MLLFDVLEIYLQLHTPNWSNILQLISQVKSFLTPPLVPSQGFLLWFCLFSSYLKLSEMGWVGYLSFLYSMFPFPVGMIALIISCLQLNVLHCFTIKNALHSTNSRSIHLYNKMCMENVCTELDFDLGLSV
jgi:hypothetical protein